MVAPTNTTATEPPDGCRERVVAEERGERVVPALRLNQHVVGDHS